ncbi:TPA: hypothetical protein QHK07_001377 [Klebsiella aerogenes]|nr:hypothetical protein [Klebsiella aerogenes]
MKINHWGILGLAGALFHVAPSAMADTQQTTLFVENNIDSSFFITYTGSEVVISGSNRWGSMRLRSAGYQTSLGYISDNQYFATQTEGDLWLDNPPISYLMAGQSCDSYGPSARSGCDESTSTLPGAVVEKNGIYGAKVDTNLRGTLSEAFYQYMQQMPTGSSFSMVMYTCATSTTYDPTSTWRCSRVAPFYSSGTVTITKSAHLTLINTNSVDEVFINSDGVPTPAEGNTNCKLQTVGAHSGLACKMVSYSLDGGGGAQSVLVYPMILNSALAAMVPSQGSYDMQFSLDGSTWKPVSNSSVQSYTLGELTSSSAIYFFFSERLFKKMVESGITDTDSKDLLNLRIERPNGTPTISRMYEFTTSNSLLIKPRDFSISITAKDYSDAPSLAGYVGEDEPSLDFNYIVTTTGKTAADEVLIKATGPTQQINGRAYCIFSANDGSIKVPFPATLSFSKQDGSIKTYDAGCDGSWRDMTDALWITSAWTDISGEAGTMDKATVKFSIPMNDEISLKTLDNNEWYGDVSASGEIYVQATWRDIN